MLAELPIVDVWRILRYILSQHHDIGGDDLTRALLEYAPERKDEIMNKFFQEIGEDFFKRGKAEGLAAGEARGEAKGEAKGKAETLLRQLSHRFGELPDDVEQCVRKADVETLDRWALRILDAKSLKDVIAN